MLAYIPAPWILWVINQQLLLCFLVSSPLPAREVHHSSACLPILSSGATASWCIRDPITVIVVKQGDGTETQRKGNLNRQTLHMKTNKRTAFCALEPLRR